MSASGIGGGYGQRTFSLKLSDKRDDRLLGLKTSYRIPDEGAGIPEFEKCQTKKCQITVYNCISKDRVE